MGPIKYHPLISTDEHGRERYPMFMSDDEESMKEHHSMWLESISSTDHWLISKEPMQEDEMDKLKIYCPMCGKVMKKIGPPMDAHRLSLYCCTSCSKEKRRKEDEQDLSNTQR